MVSEVELMKNKMHIQKWLHKYENAYTQQIKTAL